MQDTLKNDAIAASQEDYRSNSSNQKAGQIFSQIHKQFTWEFSNGTESPHISTTYLNNSNLKIFLAFDMRILHHTNQVVFYIKVWYIHILLNQFNNLATGIQFSTGIG